jgi:serpin B
MKAKYLIILLSLLFISTSSFANEKPVTTCDKDQQDVAAGNNEFAFDLYAKLSSQKGNLFFSPYSISTALAMVYAGAAGNTQLQMGRVLNLITDPCDTTAGGKNQTHKAYGRILEGLNDRGKKGAYQLSIANALWGQQDYKFHKDYLELVKTNYGSGLIKVDFKTAAEAARLKINAWVEKKTKNKIRNLISPGVLDSMTRLVLTNAIYFKGNWASKFKEKQTRPEPFTLIDGKKIQTPMMNQTSEFKYTQLKNFQALELPYVKDELSMIILLPKEGVALPDFEKTVTAKKLDSWLRKLLKRKVIVSIPKFKQRSQFGLGNILQSMGMTDAFSRHADFSAMTPRRDLYISAVIHKAFVDVNEEGTEAAAATAVTMRTTSILPEKLPVFRADRPFVFIIRDNTTSSILFIGRVMNPKK